MRLRLISVSAAFGILLAIIANLAYETARDAGPWFTAAVSLQAYSVLLLVSTVLALALSAVATNRIARIDESFLTLEEVRAALHGGTPSSLGLLPSRSAPDAVFGDEHVDEALRLVLEGSDSDGSKEVSDRGLAAPLVRLVQGKAGEAKAVESPTADLRLHRQLLRTLKRRVWLTVAGPLVVSLAFAAACATMLLGAEGFLQYHYTLNTALLLFLGYSWAPLLAWSIAAMALLPSATARPTA